jgi:hypothetical protein
MGKLEVHLQDGFAGDEVTAELGGRPVYHGQHVKTHPLLGLAAQFDCERGEGSSALKVSVLNRGLSETIVLPADAPGYLGVSIRRNRIVARPSARRFAYA